MNSFKKIVAVTLVTALCFVAMCVPASAVTVKSDFEYFDYINNGLLVPSPEYPNAESLPYGGETLIYEIPKKVDGGVEFYRVYIRKDVDLGSTYSIWNGTTALLSCTQGTVADFNFQFVSKAPIYYQKFVVLDASPSSFEFSSVTRIDGGNVYDGVTYPSMSIQGELNGTSSVAVGQFMPQTLSNSSPMIGGRIASVDSIYKIPNYERFAYIRDEDSIGTIYLNPGNFRYPSSSDLQSMRDKVTNDKLDGIQDSIDSGVQDIIDSFTVVSDEIKGAINEGVSDILNAGSDMPTVDTNNDWMNDSITQMNEWLSELEAFEEQMKQNEIDNSENMAQASTFINGFFDVVPGAIKAGLVLILVMIVVVKIIGRG